MVVKVVTRIVRAVARPRGGAALLLILSIFAALLASQWVMTTDALGDDLPTARPLGSLKAVAVPQPSNLSSFVRNEAAAVQLGKAFFWDMQTGSDGLTACASCHFKAGADGRTKNTLHPGATGFDVGGPNATLSPADFPIGSDDRVGSQGVHRAQFVGIVPGSAVDQTTVVPDPVFQVGGTNVRQSTGRQAPSIINAIFNFDNFWDGRAEFDFNGVNPFGARDPNARVLQVQAGGVQPVAVSIDHASLASQAVGPPNNDVEMAAAGRTFPQLGRKMLSLTPLGQQSVHPNDSALGALANPAGTGLTSSYADMIKAAFQPQWWDSGQLVNGFTVIENNFSLYWGLAIQLYESSLVSNDSRFDRFMEGNASALTAQERLGLEVFQRDDALCIQCHGGPEFTNASVGSMSGQLLKLMNMGDDQPAVYDNGFYNIGVRPTGEDVGVGGLDPFGNPLSRSRLAQVGGRVAVDGAVKVPSLRNVELTGPYFRNGGMATLRQVLDFYDDPNLGFAKTNIANLDPHMLQISLNDEEMNALAAFLRALTDDRVRLQRAPFDHPQLFVPNGHVGDENAVTAQDELLEIPAVGNGGGPPLQPIAPEPPPDRQGPNPGPSSSTLSSSSSPNATSSSSSSSTDSVSSGSRISNSASHSSSALSRAELPAGRRIPGNLTSTSTVSGETSSVPAADAGSGQTNRVMGVTGLALIGAALAMATGRINAARSRRPRPPDSPGQ